MKAFMLSWQAGQNCATARRSWIGMEAGRRGEVGEVKRTSRIEMTIWVLRRRINRRSWETKVRNDEDMIGAILGGVYNDGDGLSGS
jgi:hypothetical protein